MPNFSFEGNSKILLIRSLLSELTDVPQEMIHSHWVTVLELPVSWRCGCCLKYVTSLWSKSLHSVTHWLCWLLRHPLFVSLLPPLLPFVFRWLIFPNLFTPTPEWKYLRALNMDQFWLPQHTFQIFCYFSVWIPPAAVFYCSLHRLKYDQQLGYS